ncbi:uncharacterized protein LOC132942960 [Metopolophium dirhodum]|uniref:uncharacterized protein LOC132942960 n=1 Tax=Metopolophium dirhodum TaxID=44670 RepID=UPI00298F8F40|nr:uncharacterized protein LOC132942960 [Metopolophium dirhodum]
MAWWLPIFSLVLSLLAADHAVSSGKLPSYVSPCKRDSDDLNQCIVNVWEALRPKMGEGIPKLKIPPLGPFLLPETNIDRRSDSLDVKATLTQLAIMGVNNVVFSKLNVNLTDLKGSVSLAFADLNVTTLYVMDAMLMKIIPMKGQGKFNGTINDIKVNMTGKAELSPKNERGHSYLKLVEIKFKGFIGDAKGRLVDTTKNPDNSIFAETANMFYESNRREVLDVLTPFIEEFCESLFLGVANQILSTLPFEEMFIEAAPKNPPPLL